MRSTFFISMFLHVAILAYAIVGFASPRDFKPIANKPLPVDILTPAEFDKLKAGNKKPKTEKAADKKEPPKKKVEEKKKPKKKKAKAVRAPSQSEPEKVIVPAKKKKAEEKKKKAVKKKPKPKPKKKKAEKPKPKPKTKKVKKKSKKKFDSDDIAALLNKIPDKGAPDKPKPKAKKKAAAKGQGGLDRRLAASVGGQVRRRIENECWIVPVGGRDVDNLVVKIKFELDKGGNLRGQPKILNRVNSPATRAVSESAKRAIWECQPYFEFTSRLPDNYKDWKSVTMNFDMREIYGN